MLWHIWRATLGFNRREFSHRTYANEREERAYWESAMRWNLCLQTSGAMKDWSIPVITSYTPTPPAPASHEDETEAIEYYLPPKAFCKWHRMVFPGRVSATLCFQSSSLLMGKQIHPSLVQAEERVKYLSSRDRRQIRRMARLVRDGDVFENVATSNANAPVRLGITGTTQREYGKAWAKWLARKGPDVAIVFA